MKFRRAAGNFSASWSLCPPCRTCYPPPEICSSLPENRRRGLVTLRQTFVRRSHGGNFAPAGGLRMSNGTSQALNSEQELASIPTAQGGLSRLAIAHLKSAGVPVAPLLRRD